MINRVACVCHAFVLRTLCTFRFCMIYRTYVRVRLNSKEALNFFCVNAHVHIGTKGSQHIISLLVNTNMSIYIYMLQTWGRMLYESRVIVHDVKKIRSQIRAGACVRGWERTIVIRIIEHLRSFELPDAGNIGVSFEWSEQID